MQSVHTIESVADKTKKKSIIRKSNLENKFRDEQKKV